MLSCQENVRAQQREICWGLPEHFFLVLPVDLTARLVASVLRSYLSRAWVPTNTCG